MLNVNIILNHCKIMSFIIDPLNPQFKGSPDQTELLNLFMVTTTEHMLDMSAGKPSLGALLVG